MVLEIADFTILDDSADGFADAVRDGIRYVSDTPGFRNARLTRSAETPTRFVLLIEWDSIEAHTVGFRESENFQRWRSIVGPHFDGPPRVEHFNEVVTYNR
ncbi:antibiotic biosynthesis monooxygenase family protein [Pseudonocardia sp. TRM90224]|uniref:antibiotic biosynthesis monooxygenase family protein n=1 Tax=Pseudonocardia sp. TRM90224 TaxID=2812678 RepID=UPI001E4E0AE6|nr:antibiotic biosynthesis monooxygenase family protein [Pseudonocardia sp. TRM90224]